MIGASNPAGIGTEAKVSLPTVHLIATAKNKSAPAASHSGEHHHHAPATGGADAAVVDMKALKSKMERSLQILEKDFAGIRGGKADPGTTTTT
jgi:hypothetical protein